MILHEDVTLRYANIYTPQTRDYDGKLLAKLRFHVGMNKVDNPDNDRLPWRESPRAPGFMRAWYNTTVPPLITLKNKDYPALIALHNEFRVRNIPTDNLFIGARCALVLNEYGKESETIVQLSELIFDTIEDFNTTGEIE